MKIDKNITSANNRFATLSAVAGVITSHSEICELTELESKYSGPVETGLIVVFIIGLLSITWLLFRYVVNLDFVYYLVGDNYLVRKGSVAAFFLCFVLFFYRPLMKFVLYHEQKKL